MLKKYFQMGAVVKHVIFVITAFNFDNLS